EPLLIHFFNGLSEPLYILFRRRLIAGFAQAANLLAQPAHFFVERAHALLVFLEALFEVLDSCVQTLLPFLSGFALGHGGGRVVSGTQRAAGEGHQGGHYNSLSHAREDWKFSRQLSSEMRIAPEVACASPSPLNGERAGPPTEGPAKVGVRGETVRFVSPLQRRFAG